MSRILMLHRLPRPNNWVKPTLEEWERWKKELLRNSNYFEKNKNSDDVWKKVEDLARSSKGIGSESIRITAEYIIGRFDVHPEE